VPHRDQNVDAEHSSTAMLHQFQLCQVPGSERRVAGVPLQEPPEDVAPVVRPERTHTEVRQTLAALFTAHHELIWRTLRRLGASPEQAADCTQQAFVIAAERFFQIRPGCERAFLFSTALGLAHTSRRREWRCQLEANMELHSQPSRQDEKVAREHYARQLMDRVLSKMDSALVSVFALFELEGLSSPEIAEVMGIPLGTVASRLRRARQVFRAEVEQLEMSAEGERP
jgi:RNA polymerase sigma-70 factor (ECF subfamily)